MQITQSQERQHQITAFVITSFLMGFILMLMFILTIFTQLPKSEAIQYVEVNFGNDVAGYGKVQTYNKPNPSPRAIDVKKSVDVVKEKKSEKAASAVPKLDNQKKSKVAPEKPAITSKVDSPIEKPEVIKPTKVETKPREIVKPKETALPQPKKIDDNALFKKTTGTAGSNGTVGKVDGIGGNSNGDKPGKVGDQGNPKGKIDAGSLYGKPGGAATGVQVNVAGWTPVSIPKDKDDSSESGKVVFTITVDTDGRVVNVRTRESTVSPTVTDFYKKLVYRARFRPDGTGTSSESTGTVTYIIKNS